MLRWIVLAPGLVLAGLLSVERLLLPEIRDQGSLFVEHYLVDELAVYIALGFFVFAALVALFYNWVGSLVALVALVLLAQASHRLSAYNDQGRVTEYIAVFPVRDLEITAENEDGAVFIRDGMWLDVFGGPRNKMRVFGGLGPFAIGLEPVE